MAYKNFDVALFLTVNPIMRYDDELHAADLDLQKMKKYVHIDKVYLETYRRGSLGTKERFLKVKDFFNKKGIRTSGAITPNPARDISERWHFTGFCYSTEEHINELKKAVSFTAGLFDEIIFDDFYFTNCRCEACIEAKGEKSWTDFRMERLNHITKEVLIKRAKEVNPGVKIIIKYPNWYEDYQTTGYDLETQSKDIDLMYTGTETRNPRYTHQTLQRYSGYFLMRYLDNVAPGKNLGAWFDAFDSSYNPGAYAQQAYLSFFAKAKEITLFCLGLLKEQHHSFVPIAGYTCEHADTFLDALGNPIGIACYKPFHSQGENYIHGYLGMLGLPLEPVPYLPYNSPVTLLTESAHHDPSIISFIKKQLLDGKTIMITSGLVKALQNSGLSEIVEIEYTPGKAYVKTFGTTLKECAYKNYSYSTEKILIPQLKFSTNDCSHIASAIENHNNFPILLRMKYGRGFFYVLTIPDNMGDLYYYPTPILDMIRTILMHDIPVRISAPGKISLFVYDNNTFIIHSFLEYNQDVTVIIQKSDAVLTNVETGEDYTGRNEDGTTIVNLSLSAGTFVVLRYSG